MKIEKYDVNVAKSCLVVVDLANESVKANAHEAIVAQLVSMGLSQLSNHAFLVAERSDEIIPKLVQRLSTLLTAGDVIFVTSSAVDSLRLSALTAANMTGGVKVRANAGKEDETDRR